MNFDVESSTKSIKGFRRRWNSLPRVVRLYLTIAISVVFFLIVILVLPKASQKLAKRRIPGDNSNKFADNYYKLDNEIDVNGGFNDQIKEDKNEINDPLREEVNNEKDNKQNEYLSETKDDLSVDTFARSKLRFENKEQEAISNAMKHSWSAYKKYAWGADHLKPITKSRHNWFGIGLTILDSLDTLIFMGLDDEFKDALNWIKSELRFDKHKDVNCFEMTIRSLGGLLSAYQLSKEPELLIKASDLGDRLINCFETPLRLVPYSDVNLRTKVPKTPSWSPDSSLSETTTVQIEFRELSHLTGIKKYQEMSFLTSQFIHNYTVKTGQNLLPMYINPHSGEFTRSTITMGARSDSYYEYLIKQYIQTGIKWLKDDFIKAMDEIKVRLLRTTNGPLKLTFIGEILRSSSDVHPKMDHLVCYLSGTLALGYYHEIIRSPKIHGHPINENEAKFNEHITIAEDLARTCYMMYNLTATGLSPEIAYFSDSDEQELQIRPADAHNLLRPEFVESLFYLYHITGDQLYRDWAWNVFKAFEKYTKVSSGGYTSIDDVRNPSSVRPKDMQESFWTGETLKYLYLTFCDDKEVINKLLDSYVFNTEGHLFPRRLKGV